MAVIPVGSGTGIFGFGGKISNSTFSDLGGAVSDLFASSGYRAKARGDRTEAENYDLASSLALQNKQFTETSTAIKLAQQDRENFKMLGGQAADVASAGFAQSGSAIDLMRESASQGALTRAVAQQQGLITEAGYEEQAKSYTNLAGAAREAAAAEDNAATGATISGIVKGIAAVATLF